MPKVHTAHGQQARHALIKQQRVNYTRYTQNVRANNERTLYAHRTHVIHVSKASTRTPRTILMCFPFRWGFFGGVAAPDFQGCGRCAEQQRQRHWRRGCEGCDSAVRVHKLASVIMPPNKSTCG